jgi:hypothetical protein
VTNADDLAIVAIERDNRRLVQEDPFAGLIDECVDGAQIYSELVPEKLLKKFHGDGSSSKLAGITEASGPHSVRQLVCLNKRAFLSWGMSVERIKID